MHQHKRISCKEGDRAKEQYYNFLSNVVVCNQNLFKNVDKSITRLDDFLLAVYTQLMEKIPRFLACLYFDFHINTWIELCGEGL